MPRANGWHRTDYATAVDRASIACKDALAKCESLAGHGQDVCTSTAKSAYGNLGRWQVIRVWSLRCGFARTVFSRSEPAARRSVFRFASEQTAATAIDTLPNTPPWMREMAHRIPARSTT